jgi:hypothetical protein
MKNTLPTVASITLTTRDIFTEKLRSAICKKFAIGSGITGTPRLAIETFFEVTSPNSGTGKGYSDTRKTVAENKEETPRNFN